MEQLGVFSFPVSIECLPEIVKLQLGEMSIFLVALKRCKGTKVQFDKRLLPFQKPTKVSEHNEDGDEDPGNILLGLSESVSYVLKQTVRIRKWNPKRERERRERKAELDVRERSMIGCEV